MSGRVRERPAARSIMSIVNHVLVVDDEPAIVEIVRDYLADAGYRVSTAHSGDEAMRHVRSIQPDLIVLDLGLPGIDGLDVARAIRQSSSVPIIMLTARSEEADRVVGLELGADDYLVKPFSPRELLARVRAVLRRSRVAARPDDNDRQLVVGELTVDRLRRLVTVGSTAIDLTATEFDLLARMAAAPGRVFTRGQLLETIHGVAVEAGERAIDAHVKNLRRKIEDDPHRPVRLVTVHGVGYRLADS
ncbi:MAG: response regulator transcription factor [Actinomycetota bacterium]|nr:response regulator transcription factor [Actinomycetota bacterium]